MNLLDEGYYIYNLAVPHRQNRRRNPTRNGEGPNSATKRKKV